MKAQSSKGKNRKDWIELEQQGCKPSAHYYTTKIFSDYFNF